MPPAAHPNQGFSAGLSRVTAATRIGFESRGAHSKRRVQIQCMNHFIGASEAAYIIPNDEQGQS